MKKGSKDSYSRAIAELEVIVAEIEAGATDVDLLAEKTKRAFYLIGLCRAKLSQTENEVKAVLQKLEQGTETATDGTAGHDLDL
jgi:exodeoxyribonuclease VII small subunit